MSNEVIVHKGRLTTIRVNVGYDVSEYTLTSEIRTEPNVEAPLIATWTVAYESDGTDGKLLLTIDDTAGNILANSGWMDIKQDDGMYATPIFDEPLAVVFRGSVTE